MDKLPNRLRFFARFPSSEYKSRVVAYPGYDRAQYAIDFQHSASTLANSMAGKPEDDRLLMPVLFLYRHAFELRLKEMLARLDVTPRAWGGRGLTQAQDRTSQHSLKTLVDAYRNETAAMMEEEFPSGLLEVIYELHELDPGSLAFRYADRSAFTELWKRRDPDFTSVYEDGLLTAKSVYIDFPAMAKFLNEAWATLGAVQDYVEDRAGWNGATLWSRIDGDTEG